MSCADFFVHCLYSDNRRLKKYIFELFYWTSSIHSGRAKWTNVKIFLLHKIVQKTS